MNASLRISLQNLSKQICSQSITHQQAHRTKKRQSWSQSPLDYLIFLSLLKTSFASYVALPTIIAGCGRALMLGMLDVQELVSARLVMACRSFVLKAFEEWKPFKTPKIDTYKLCREHRECSSRRLNEMLFTHVVL